MQTNGISIHPLPQPQIRWERLALQPAAFQQARSLSADLYQIHDPELLPVAFLLKKTTGARIVYDMHEDYRSKGGLLGRGLRGLERWAFRWVDHVLFAEKSYRSIVDGAPVSSTCIENYYKPIGDAARTDRKRASSLDGAPMRLLYTGTVADSRGLRTMIDLASRIREDDRSETIDLVGICHHDDQRAAAERRISEEGLGKIVNRVGWDTYVRPSNMPPYYRRADVGLALCNPHPNYSASVPTKFYEYLHYGLPLICSDFPLWQAFVEEHDCGAVVPPGDAAAVLEVLSRWQCRPERYRECVENARAAAPAYRWETMEDRLLGVYDQLLSASEGRVE